MNSLGLSKKPAETRIVVAMSGGVDSSVTAACLVEQGYQVVGVTLQLYDHGAAVGRKGACCAGQDIHDARRVADRLGIDHYVLDYESRFKNDVMSAFADAYAHGETPVPCITCNRTVKFRDLLATARDLGAEALATGHYVRRIMGADGAQLHRAVDAIRDQSYFLFATTAEQLDYLRFPLGDLAKAQTRELARRFDLPVAAKPDSQDICFVPDGDYARVVERLRPEAGEPGEIVHVDGTPLGKHGGIIHFTVGQRRGLNVGERAGTDNEPLYVVRLDPALRRVVVGPRAALAEQTVLVRDVNWLAGRPLDREALRVSVKLRSAQNPASASAYLDEGGLRVDLDEPQFGIAPGQACVIYDGERVLGGGWIRRNEARHAA